MEDRGNGASTAALRDHRRAAHVELGRRRDDGGGLHLSSHGSRGSSSSEAFFFPLGTIIRVVGGIPIDRTARRNVVGEAVEQFRRSEQLILAVPPEGTRKHSPGWKTGFYLIARGAEVPIVLGYLDYKRKVAGLGPAFVPTGDIEADFRVFDEFYAKVTPKYPADRGPVVPMRVAQTSRRSASGG